MKSVWMTSRRDLIKNSITGALGISFGFTIPWRQSPASEATADSQSAASLSAFVKIFNDNQIEIAVAKCEMGQGVATSLAMIISEELDADWQMVNIELVGEQPPYFDPETGGLAATFGSTSVRAQYQRLRQIGASVRKVLLTATADKLGIAVADLHTKNSQIYDAQDNLVQSYGGIAREALTYPLPEQTSLKSPAEFRLIGQATVHIDAKAKINGEAVFGSDVDIPGMLYAAIKHHPAFGSKLVNFADLTPEVPADFLLVELPNALGLVGPSYWQAQQILNQLPTKYETDATLIQNQSEVEAKYLSAVENFDGIEVRKQGSIDSAMQESEQSIQASYLVPYLAHGALEPMNCTAIVQDDHCEFWIPTQSAQLSSFAISQAINRPPHEIKINVTYVGGSFGRKVETDFVSQAALLAQAARKPVKLIWSRQEDTQHDFFRPAFSASFQAEIGAGKILAWQAKNAGPSVMNRSGQSTGQADFMSIEGFADIPYEISTQQIFHEELRFQIPVGYWRSVGKSHNVFFVESFIDELAHALALDPLELRLELLNQKPRAQRLLHQLAKISQWHDRKDKLGMAYMEGFGSIAALACQVELSGQQLKTKKIFCVVDCGQVVNPDGAHAQIEGGAIFGLAAALSGKITIKDGRVEQRLFGDMPPLRMADAPEVAIHFMDSDASMGGLGEVSTPLVAPALCNAIFRTNGKRIRQLPVRDFL